MDCDGRVSGDDGHFSVLASSLPATAANEPTLDDAHRLESGSKGSRVNALPQAASSNANGSRHHTPSFSSAKVHERVERVPLSLLAEGLLTAPLILLTYPTPSPARVLLGHPGREQA